MSNKIDLVEALKNDLECCLDFESVVVYREEIGDEHDPVLQQLLEIDEHHEVEYIVREELSRAFERIANHGRIKQMLEEVRLDASDVSLVKERACQIKEYNAKKYPLGR